MNPEPARVFVVIPVLNHWEETARCLQTLGDPGDSNVAVVVVDHGSTDATKTELPIRFPYVIHLLETEDLWWTGATNVGIRYALEHGADHVVPLNNDCLLTGESLHRLVALASSEKAIVAPVQRAAHTREIRAVTAQTALGLGFVTLRIDTTLDPTAGELVNTGLIIGGRGAVLSRRILDVVGLFAEEELPHYHADTDFYLRCARAGIPLLVAQSIDVLVGETSTSLATVPAGTMSWPEFRETLRSPRSHRNLPALRAFFRRNYPIRFLWPLGLFLYASRTILLWAVARARVKLLHRR